MSKLSQTLHDRADSTCELCDAAPPLSVHTVAPHTEPAADHSALVCQTCLEQMTEQAPVTPRHWFCLQESIWSPVPPVQVLAWRQLQKLKEHVWAQDLLEQAYIDDDTMAWARALLDAQDEAPEPTLDCFGNTLERGDNVVLVKTLNVKGTSFSAPHGTVVKNIRLTRDPKAVEGRINGQMIVLKTEFVKKG